MNDRFPQFVLKENAGKLFWEGVLTTNAKTRYLVNIVYPDSYPNRRPAFNIIEPRVAPDSPHVYLDGSLCVFPKHWNYKRCTAPAGVPLVAGWLAMYEVWRRTGKRW
jgi:hypothetical protein